MKYFPDSYVDKLRMPKTRLCISEDYDVLKKRTYRNVDRDGNFDETLPIRTEYYTTEGTLIGEILESE